jgi:hypothetical protein
MLTRKKIRPAHNRVLMVKFLAPVKWWRFERVLQWTYFFPADSGIVEDADLPVDVRLRRKDVVDLAKAHADKLGVDIEYRDFT